MSRRKAGYFFIFNHNVILVTMQYVKICSFDNYIPAHLLLGRLEDEGINAWLKDEHTVTIDPLLTNAVGGIKLMVHVAQVDRAKALLAEWERASGQPQQES